MSKSTLIKEAIGRFEKEQHVVANEAQKVDLTAQVPPIDKMDASLGVLKSCEHLSLSTNNIEKLAGLNSLPKLKVLSLGRNQIKKLEALDGVAETLQELWISYNLLEKLAGVEKLVNLRVLWMSNNKVKDWAELDRLAASAHLEDLLLLGNPLNPAPGSPEYRMEVLKRLPGLKKLDGVPVDPEERESAKAA
ncbi:hypothetical protein WJX75_008207 [Coccomyxa subellipsoidea]|uniref:Dynein axonemal light chain 1 n=1 Tax=Coccomyxa subellipsoidea TaxID=248742 RepID=A0ABR2YNH5_9CHLO